MYCTGGLEYDPSEKKILTIDGVNYVVGDKFKTMLRDAFIDWGTFLELYQSNPDLDLMVEQATKLLNIKPTAEVREFLLPAIARIYTMPLEAHVASMMRQFMVYEPVSMSILSLFMLIKDHFERIVRKFVEVRNQYIKTNKTKDKQNDWNAVLERFEEANQENDLQSSSIILLLLNPPKDLGIDRKKISLQIKVRGVQAIDSLQKAIKEFNYRGYCPKVPHERLGALLKFPLKEFCDAILALDPTVKFPDYQKLESRIKEILLKKPAKPALSAQQLKDVKLPDLPENLKPIMQEENGRFVAQEMHREIDKQTGQSAYHPGTTIDDKRLTLIKWYVDNLLEMRKKLLSYCKEYENYYIQCAEIIGQIKNALVDDLTNEL
jgi:hypothetical protein